MTGDVFLCLSYIRNIINNAHNNISAVNILNFLLPIAIKFLNTEIKTHDTTPSTIQVKQYYKTHMLQKRQVSCGTALINIKVKFGVSEAFVEYNYLVQALLRDEQCPANEPSTLPLHE